MYSAQSGGDETVEMWVASFLAFFPRHHAIVLDQTGKISCTYQDSYKSNAHLPIHG